MRKFLFVASEVRSGSTYFSENLAYRLENDFGFSFFDVTREKFNTLCDSSTAKDIADIADNLFLDISGWAASKIMCGSLSVIMRECSRSNDLKMKMFGEHAFWIVVRRKDKIKQAISLAFARQSGIYHHYDTNNNDPDGEVELESYELRSALKAIEMSDQYLTVFSETLPKNRFVEIFYEDFCENIDKTLERIYNQMGFEFLPKSKNENLSKLLPTSVDKKVAYEDKFKEWFLENYHQIGDQSV